ncbi:MAG TPA: HD domain-containing protein [Acidimicrobiia bacterium]|jgi:(p)ppGpp synthase/HD superfamily hydrolase
MPTDGRPPAVLLDEKFTRAVAYACDRHAKQARKGTDVPYVSHLLMVAALVLDDGGTRTQAVAGLLHDVLEDTDARRKDVRRLFGRKVARIVDGCTEQRGGSPASSANWFDRKLAVIEHLRDPGTKRSVLRVKAADTLANARSLLADLRRNGPEVWLRFHRGAADQLWYYRSLSTVLSMRLPGLLSDELRVTVRELEDVAGWWFDVGDPQPGSGAPTR